MTAMGLALFLLVAPAASLAQTDDQKIALMVPDVGASGGIGQDVVEPIDELLLSRFQALGVYRVFGTADLVDILETEQRKMLLGCEDDSCLAQVGGALGVSLIAKATVGKLGETHIFNLKIIDVSTADVEARCVREVDGPVDGVLPAVGECIDEVTEQLSGRYGLRAGGPGTTFGPVPLYVAGGVAVASGIATLALDLAVGRKADALRDDPHDADAYDSGTTLQTAERVALAATIAAAIAAGTLAVFTDFGGRPAEEERIEVGPTVGADAAGLVLRARF
jgi:hypothetical protein